MSQLRKDHSDNPRDQAALEAVARFLGCAPFGLDPTRAASPDVSGLEVFFGKRLLIAEEFEDSFSELHARRPGFINARVGQDVRAAAALANPGVAISNQVRSPRDPITRVLAPRTLLRLKRRHRTVASIQCWQVWLFGSGASVRTRRDKIPIEATISGCT